MFPYQVFKDMEQVSQEAAALVLEWAEHAVQQQGEFFIALAGGSTPKRLYQVLSQPPYHESMPWANTQIFFGDERSVALDHPDSNYHMAYENLLSSVAISPDHVHPMHAELHGIRHHACDYQAQLERLPKNDFGLPEFDLILLGMGDDGHTASLFPNSAILHETQRWVVANYVDQNNTWRMSLTFPVINAAAHVLFMVCGANKANKVGRIQQGETFPAQRVQPEQGELLWLLDEAAAAGIHDSGNGR